MDEVEQNIGFTTGQNDSDVFRFVLNPAVELRKWEYVTLSTGSFSIIGRVERLQSFNEMIQESISYERLKEIIETISTKSVDIAVCRTVGSIGSEGDVSKGNRILIRPGMEVKRSTEEEMRTLFGYSRENSIVLGNLSNYRSVGVGASINGLRRHVAIMAQTGAGKSNTAAVMIEELIRKGATVVVLDPHADYALMKAEAEVGNYTKVFKTPLSTGRYSSELNALTDQFTIRFQDLDENDLFDIMRIDDEWTTLKEITRKILEGTRGKGDLDDFVKSYQALERTDRGRIAGRIALLKAIKGIFGNTTTTIDSYLKEGQLSILDLSGLDQDVMSYFCLRVLDEIYDAKVAGTFRYPVFVFIEEAHNFVGRESKGKLPDLIKKIASEGRKFGMFLVVITQRPGKIDQDVLSQCNSQIILRITNPMDQRAIEESCEGVSASVINDLPSLNTGEAVLVGEFVRFPVIVKIRKRETREGGGDVDVISLLKESFEARNRRLDPSENRKVLRGLLED
ncbi:MAG: ATP-binding protein [Candidatus Thermoplasmatota archaeon]|jgi:hypothetical protein|nr:ATP-binding protein [Candidatus Thermoplasmatota archaeon]